MSIQIFASQHKYSCSEFGIEYSFFIGRIRECVHKKTVYLFTVSVSFICLGHEYRALLFRVEEQCLAESNPSVFRIPSLFSFHLLRIY
jgi:hypothetical protein